MQEYDSKCLNMYLITLKVFIICYKMFAPITKVNEGESNTPCPSRLEVIYSSVEKLSKALGYHVATPPTMNQRHKPQVIMSLRLLR
jgi:hypothetical protein